MRWSTFLLTSPDVGGRLDDIAQLVRQIILAAHGAAINRYTRAHRRRRYGENSENHPLRTSVFVRETKKVEIRIGYLLESRVDLMWWEQPFVRLERLDLLSCAVRTVEQMH